MFPNSGCAAYVLVIREGRTASEEAVLGENCDRVDDENDDWIRLGCMSPLAQYLLTVNQVPKAEEQHGCAGDVVG